MDSHGFPWISNGFGDYCFPRHDEQRQCTLAQERVSEDAHQPSSQDGTQMDPPRAVVMNWGRQLDADFARRIVFRAFSTLLGGPRGTVGARYGPEGGRGDPAWSPGGPWGVGVVPMGTRSSPHPPHPPEPTSRNSRPSASTSARAETPVERINNGHFFMPNISFRWIFDGNSTFYTA